MRFNLEMLEMNSALRQELEPYVRDVMQCKDKLEDCMRVIPDCKTNKCVCLDKHIIDRSLFGICIHRFPSEAFIIKRSFDEAFLKLLIKIDRMKVSYGRSSYEYSIQIDIAEKKGLKQQKRYLQPRFDNVSRLEKMSHYYNCWYDEFNKRFSTNKFN